MEITVSEKKYRSNEAEEVLGLRPGVLAVMRCRGRGPAFYKLGKRVVYGESQLRAWLQANARTTSESSVIESK